MIDSEILTGTRRLACNNGEGQAARIRIARSNCRSRCGSGCGYADAAGLDFALELDTEIEQHLGAVLDDGLERSEMAVAIRRHLLQRVINKVRRGGKKEGDQRLSPGRDDRQCPLHPGCDCLLVWAL